MINLTLRIFFISGSLITLLFVLIRIRISKIQIRDSIFWILFLLILLAFSVFPKIPSSISKLLHFQSPSNFILLFVIFILTLQLFFMSMKLSKFDADLRALTQRFAISEKSKQDLADDDNTNH